MSQVVKTEVKRIRLVHLRRSRNYESSVLGGASS